MINLNPCYEFITSTDILKIMKVYDKLLSSYRKSSSEIKLKNGYLGIIYFDIINGKPSAYITFMKEEDGYKWVEGNSIITNMNENKYSNIPKNEKQLIAVV